MQQLFNATKNIRVELGVRAQVSAATAVTKTVFQHMGSRIEKLYPLVNCASLSNTRALRERLRPVQCMVLTTL